MTAPKADNPAQRRGPHSSGDPKERAPARVAPRVSETATESQSVDPHSMDPHLMGAQSADAQSKNEQSERAFSAGAQSQSTQSQSTQSQSTQTQNSISNQTPGHTGSLSGRMMVIAAIWILILLAAGGFALDRTMTSMMRENLDEQLKTIVTAMISASDLGPRGEVRFYRQLGNQKFLEPNSGLYWQVDGGGYDTFPSHSLWDRTLKLRDVGGSSEMIFYNSDEFDGEPLRVAQRTVILPESETRWTFTAASSLSEMNEQIRRIRSILIWSFAILGLGLLIMAALQTYYGLRPLRRVRKAIQRIRKAEANRVIDPLPLEVQPLVDELNMLLAFSENQAAEARTHAGNLAHALKTPLTVINNAATAKAQDLPETAMRETKVMRRHVDHHLARARALGRRTISMVRTPVCPSAEAVRRAVQLLHPKARIDIAGNAKAVVAIERQDLDELLGNLIENAAKYGGGSVFVTVDVEAGSAQCEIWVEDDGAGIPEDARKPLFDRGARLDTDKPGTGLGLAIVRDVAQIYSGSVELDESEDLGGLLVRLRLPRNAEIADEESD